MLSWAALERETAKTAVGCTATWRRGDYWRLEKLGVAVSRARLEQWIGRSVSAQELTLALLEGWESKDRFDQDRVWIYLDAPWQRWFPERPSS